MTHGHITAIINFLGLILSELSHSQSPQNSKTYLQSLKTKPETRYYGKAKETNFTSVKKANILSFLGNKCCRMKKTKNKNPDFLERL